MTNCANFLLMFYLYKYVHSMHGFRKICQRGSKFYNFFVVVFLSFLVDEGIEDPNITLKRSSSARQRNIENIVDPDQTND